MSKSQEYARDNFQRPSAGESGQQEAASPSVDFDVLSGIMDQLAGNRSPDPDEVTRLWNQLGPDGREMVMKDGTMGPKARELGLGAPQEQGGWLDRIKSSGSALLDQGSNRASQFYENIARWGADDVTPEEHAAQAAAENAAPDQRQRAQDRPEQTAQGDGTVYDDGKSKVDLQAKIDETFEAYDSVPVEITIEGTTYSVEVEAKYRNVGANKDWLGAKDVAVSQGLNEWAFGEPLRQGEVDGVKHSDDFLDAYYGKASPEALGEALEEAVVTNSDLQGQVDAAQSKDDVEAAIKESLEGWAQERLGIDCSGFVWQVINRSGEYDDFSPTYDDAGNKATAHDDRISLVNAERLLDNGVDLTGKPGEWRPMDVCGWSKHVLMIYDTAKRDSGVWQVTLIDSRFSKGPTKGTAYYNATTDTWGFNEDKVAEGRSDSPGYLGRIETVRRPTNPEDVA